MDQGDSDRLVSAIDKLTRTAEKLESPRSESSATTNINLNFGTKGIWLPLVIVVIVIAVFYLGYKYDRMEDYLQAIYTQAPHLKPQEVK